LIIQALEREQLGRLLDVAWGACERHGILLTVTYNHAMRASEATGLTAEDVSEHGIKIRGLKGGEVVSQPLIKTTWHPLLMEEQPLLNLIDGLISDERVFGVGRHRFWELMQRYGKLADLPEALRHPHCLRHSCGTHLRENKVPLEEIQAWMRHRDLGSTGIYLRPTQQMVNTSVLTAMRAGAPTPPASL